MSSLGDVLFLDREVSTYNTSTTSRSRVLNYHYSEVFILSFLREGNTSRISTNNTSIKLKIIVSHKAFILLS